MVVIDDNDLIIDLADVDLNINDNEKYETKQQGICVNTQGGRGGR